MMSIYVYDALLAAAGFQRCYCFDTAFVSDDDSAAMERYQPVGLT